MKAALYIHIPFCRQRCTYCDFNTYTGLLDLRTAYTEALLEEMALHARRYPDLQATSLYLGGGTPSLLPVESVARLIEAAWRHFALSAAAEISVEANPGTLTGEMLLALRRAGANRLSLGVQSARAEELALLGRIHTWEEVVGTVGAAREVGFENLSLDLIFGLPGQALEAWEETLSGTLALQPDHLSLYALTLEPGTPLAGRVSAGELPAPDADLAAQMYERATERLHVAGFWQYEISNWARGIEAPPAPWALPPGGQSEGIGPTVSRHNLTYWRNRSWLGLGAGAHSWLEGRRWSSLPHPSAYISRLRAQGLPLLEEETISGALERGETMMMGLRLAEGVTEARFRRRFGVGFAETFGGVIERFGRLGLLSWDGRRLRLTAAGRLLGNPIFAEFLPDVEAGHS